MIGKPVSRELAFCLEIHHLVVVGLNGLHLLVGSKLDLQQASKSGIKQ